MPRIARHECDRCGFRLPSGWGGVTYAVDVNGARVTCPHPGEFHTIFQVTGMRYAAATTAGRVGFGSDCVCTTCLEQFRLDLDRDRRACLKCGSTAVRSVREAIDQECPKCRSGVIRAGPLIRPPLDDDWQSLPMPSVVKELAAYELAGQLPGTLRCLYNHIGALDVRKMTYALLNLLEQWTGGRRPPRTSIPLDRDLFWCAGLSDVLVEVPELARLICIDADEIHIAPALTADERRGISNYLRATRAHEVWC